MKALVCLFLMASLGSSFAWAADPAPLITKVSGNGFVHPDWAQRETCKVYPTKVVITHSYNGGKVVTERELAFQLQGDITTAIARAATEEVRKSENHLCDGPVTIVTARQQGQEDLVLYHSGGCGHDQDRRVGPFSNTLVEIVNQFCPIIYVAQSASDQGSEPDEQR